MAYIPLIDENPCIAFGHGHLKILPEELEIVTKEGECAYCPRSEFDDVFVSTPLYYHCFDKGNCFIVINEYGSSVFKFSMTQVEYHRIEKLSRTDLIDEGLDYVLIAELSEVDDDAEGALLCYEHGAIRFDAKGDVLWRYKPENTLLNMPEIQGQILIYNNYSGTTVISLADGGLLDKS